jgi:hypothetical protein
VFARANPEQLFRDAQQAEQSGNNELVVQKYQPYVLPTWQLTQALCSRA